MQANPLSPYPSPAVQESSYNVQTNVIVDEVIRFQPLTRSSTPHPGSYYSCHLASMLAVTVSNLVSIEVTVGARVQEINGFGKCPI